MSVKLLGQAKHWEKHVLTGLIFPHPQVYHCVMENINITHAHIVFLLFARGFPLQAEVQEITLNFQLDFQLSYSWKLTTVYFLPMTFPAFPLPCQSASFTTPNPHLSPCPPPPPPSIILQASP